MIVVIGTPDSGKSALAEKVVEKLSNGQKMAYIATMIPFGEEGENRIKKHKQLRANKNFVTFEEPYSLSSLIDTLRGENINTALLECVSNLVGNVIHKQENINKSDYELTGLITNDIFSLADNTDNLVVVANDFEINSEYDEDTVRYININNAVNEKLRKASKQYYVVNKGEWTLFENN